MKLAPSVQQKIMWLTPTYLLEILARTHPKFVIKLLCHWLNEKNPNLEERSLAPRLINPVGVSKKMSRLSVISILHLLKQEGEDLWRFYIPNMKGGFILKNLGVLPYILLEVMFELGGEEGKKKVKEVVSKCRTTLGSAKQAEILRSFKTKTVLDIFEMMPDGEVGMILKSSMKLEDAHIIALWLSQLDTRKRMERRNLKSLDYLATLPAEKAFEIEKHMKALEFRRPLTPEIPEGEK